MARVFAAALFLLSAVASAQDSPMAKVVTLLEDLKSKIETDGLEDQKVYDKFACWCEKTTARKAAMIESGKTNIESLSEKIISLKGKTSSYAADVAQLQKDIAGNQQGQADATAIRKKETEDYLSS